MKIQQYLDNINKRYKLGNATEHTFRGDLQQLIENLVPGIAATNEPKRQSCGAPDYILTKKDIPVGFIEAKDIDDNDLKGEKKTGNKEQFDRYKSSLGNLIFTDYLDFHLYIDGIFKTSVRIAEIKGGKIVALPQHFNSLENLIKDFCSHISQTIKSSKKLAEMMAGKARMLAEVIDKSLTSDEENQEDSTLKEQMAAFKQILIHDIKPKEFADIYAQTIAYGMFAARLHDHTLPTFSRQEAAELIPKSNPFLRKLFGYIAGPDIDERIKWIVDSLADIFRATDVATLLKDFGKSTQTEDPIIHFYETFLSEYDPKLRKARGVWYTPEPIVNFIVRAVDDILKTEFGLKDGLSDTSKVKIKIDLQKTDKRYSDNVKKIEQEVHKVQILDPATGTGTFLAEVVKHIYKQFEGQEGIWSNYVDNHLIPRLNGFELLMASYAMAHLKLSMLFDESGYKPKKEQRFKIYLTNSLEESHPHTGTLFANWLSAEANEANQVKRDTPVMCVIGNPPYSVSSTNKSAWIENLVLDYKKNLNERNIQPLSDDYIKFIRFGQHFIEKNGEGILAYISNNSFLDGIIHRQMRKHLLETFDSIYILDLHGNSKKKETSTDGSVDQNVFDIMQGVSINIFIKTGKKKKNDLGKLFHHELLGKRTNKYDFLLNSNVESIKWKTLKTSLPNLYFTNKNTFGISKYEKGFKIDKLFKIFSNGFTTERDAIAIHFKTESLKQTVNDLINLNEEEFKRNYSLEKDGRDWTYITAKNDISKNKLNYIKVLYRPFDFRESVYTGKTKGFYAFPRNEVMKNFIGHNNLGLIIPRQTKEKVGGLITNVVAGHKSFSAYDKSTIFPLYIYPDNNDQQNLNYSNEKVSNLNTEIIDKISEELDLDFADKEDSSRKMFSPISVIDYIYAILHSPSYKEKYKEFLKIDFPRIPYPSNLENFWKLVHLGSLLRKSHLMENSIIPSNSTKYPVHGDNIISKVKFENNKVFINLEQYFENIPSSIWEFYIGGFQPAQKWLKDRIGLELSFEDILYYQKIIFALVETERTMKEIDKIEIE